MSTYRIPVGSDVILYILKSQGESVRQLLVSPDMRLDDTYESAQYDRFVPVKPRINRAYRKFQIKTKEKIDEAPLTRYGVLRYFAILSDGDLALLLAPKYLAY